VIGAENALGMGHHRSFSLKAILNLSLIDCEMEIILFPLAQPTRQIKAVLKKKPKKTAIKDNITRETARMVWSTNVERPQIASIINIGNKQTM
jgi:hypothetical protein